MQLPTSADNVTLLAFAAKRHAAVHRAAGPPVAAAVDRYLPPAGPTTANPPHAAAAVDRWDRQTDRQTDTDGRPTITYTLLHSTYYAGSVKIHKRTKSCIVDCRPNLLAIIK